MDYITRARMAVVMDWENEIGGIDESYLLGEFLTVSTNKGNQYYGRLTGLVASEDEMTQDAIELTFNDDKRLVGIHSITKIERCTDGTRMD